MGSSKTRALMILILAISSGRSNAADRGLERVQTQFPKAMARLEASYTQVHGAGSGLMTHLGGTTESKISFAAQGSWRKESSVGVSFGSNQVFEHVLVVGPQANFRLRREQSEGKAYLLQHYSLPETAEPAYSQGVNSFLLAPCGIWGFPMSKLIAEPSFRITSAEEVPGGSPKLVKITYNLDHKYVKSGSIYASPEEGWAIHKLDCQVVMAPGGIEHRFLCDVEYGPPQGQMPVPRVVTYSTTPPGHEPSTFRYEIDEFVLGPVPEKEFTLSAFGLPELSVAEPEPSRLPYWLFAMAAILLSIGAAVRYWAKHRYYA